jgi:hypothetical protein
LKADLDGLHQYTQLNIGVQGGAEQTVATS